MRRGVAREERRIARDPAYRSSPSALRRLVTHNVIYESPGSPRGEWDRFHVRRIGLAVNRRMRREFGGSAQRLRAASERRVGRSSGSTRRGARRSSGAPSRSSRSCWI